MNCFTSVRYLILLIFRPPLTGHYLPPPPLPPTRTPLEFETVMLRIHTRRTRSTHRRLHARHTQHRNKSQGDFPDKKESANAERRCPLRRKDVGDIIPTLGTNVSLSCALRSFWKESTAKIYAGAVILSRLSYARKQQEAPPQACCRLGDTPGVPVPGSQPSALPGVNY